MSSNLLAFTIPDFCAAHGISKSAFYNLPKNKRPRVMKVGASRRISQEAAAQWRQQMEDEPDQANVDEA